MVQHRRRHAEPALASTQSRDARAEGIIPAPEANHAVASAIREANRAKEEGTKRVILFNLCGHGHFDMSAYEAYFSGRLERHELTQQDVDAAIADIDTPEIPAAAS